MEYWWEITDKVKPKYPQESLFQCQFVRQKSHMDCSRGSVAKKSATECLDRSIRCAELWSTGGKIGGQCMWYLAKCLFNSTTSAAPVTDEERGGCGEWATRFVDGTKVPNFQAQCPTWYGSAAGSHHVLQSTTYVT